MRRIAAGVGVLIVCFCASASHGGVIYFLVTEISGGTPPTGPAPWLKAEFTTVGPNTVDLTMSSFLNGGGTEFVDLWHFNLDPVFNPNNLFFTHMSGPVALDGVFTGIDAFMANGDGKFDIKFDFENANQSQRFDDGDISVYRITSTDPITENSFDFISAQDGGQGVYHTVAHVQGTGGGPDSGWIAEPEPATLHLLALGMLVALRRRRSPVVSPAT